MVGTAALVAAGLGSLTWLGVYDGFSIIEVIVWSTTCLMILYPGFKLFQKIRDPSRPALREVLSVYSDRLSRVILIGLLALGCWLVVQTPLEFLAQLQRFDVRAFRIIRGYFLLAGALTFFVTQIRWWPRPALRKASNCGWRSRYVLSEKSWK